MGKIFLFIILSAPAAEALELERLCEFLEEYDSSNEKQDWNWYRLAYAVEKGHLDVASFLVNMGETISGYGETYPIDESKVNPGYNKNCCDGYSKNPLITAIRKGYNDLAIEMLQTGIDFTQTEEHKLVFRKKVGSNTENAKVEIERKPAFFVAMSEGKEDLSLVQAFLEAGLDINALIYFQGNPNNETQIMASSPLYLAIEYKKFEVARLFMEYGTDPLKSCAYHISPLELAIQWGYYDLAEQFLNLTKHN